MEIVFEEKAALDVALKEYMLDVQGLEESDISSVLMDFADPFDCQWIMQNYLRDIQQDGKNYEVYACWTQFGEFTSLNDRDKFRFYMYIHRENAEDKSYGAYLKAERRFSIQTDPHDFPEEGELFFF